MKRYVDGFVIAVPTKNLAAYRKMSAKAGKVWMKHGALSYMECVGDDLSPDMGDMKMATFPRLMKLKPSETAVFSFIVYKSRAHRDRINAKVMKDPQMNDPDFSQQAMPVDPKRMVFGGFASIVNYQA